MIVIADSGPLRYLIFIDQIGLLPLLYGRIVIPREVMRELTQTATPQCPHLDGPLARVAMLFPELN
jgi:predicted nucleic acid-binding protein